MNTKQDPSASGHRLVWNTACPRKNPIPTFAFLAPPFYYLLPVTLISASFSHLSPLFLHLHCLLTPLLAVYLPLPSSLSPLLSPPSLFPASTPHPFFLFPKPPSPSSSCLLLLGNPHPVPAPSNASKLIVHYCISYLSNSFYFVSPLCWFLPFYLPPQAGPQGQLPPPPAPSRASIYCFLFPPAQHLTLS